MFERSADRRGSRSKVLAVPQTRSRQEVCKGGKKRSVSREVCRGGKRSVHMGKRTVQGGATWARREICDDREMLFNVFRGGARPSSIASTLLSILGV